MFKCFVQKLLFKWICSGHLEPTKGEVNRAIARVKLAMKGFDLLIWIISSHGGEEAGRGAFFADSEGGRVYLSKDVVRWFSVDSFPDMQDKPVFYFPSFCRVHLPPEHDPNGPRGDDGAEHFAKKNYYVVKVRSLVGRTETADFAFFS